MTGRGSSTSYESAYELQPTISQAPREAESSRDVESSSATIYTTESDPLQLSSKLKTKQELDQIRANTSRKRDGLGPIAFNKRSAKSRKLEKFYSEQNKNIERLLKPVDEHVKSAKDSHGLNHWKLLIAVRGSLAANIILAGLQVYAASTSGSLSLVATMADAIFDPLSNVNLIICNRAIKKVNARRFPSGKARIETAGNIVFCFMMTSVSFIIIVVSVLQLKDRRGDDGSTEGFNLPSVLAVAVAFSVKLALFLYCWALRNQYSQIRILWEDHRNDLFSNGFGILTSVGGSKLAWWVDPMGAIILSCLISFLWLRRAAEEFQTLIGVTADTQTQQLITYICEWYS